ncbi:Uncharacterized protein APZ42_019298 [Daphnia magna]|uniref:Uncharacterized protein n=1 Tax=Daphnia magna TaxID=35525 RepID=A0A164YGN3_9CRUS|nr:Uncharacterized protein APZ42_019298 [Daphnia magna]
MNKKETVHNRRALMKTCFCCCDRDQQSKIRRHIIQRVTRIACTTHFNGNT